ncbi:MAG TPA: DUF6503 family protein [Bdellovibrionota bacterium]|nr:DUF6503 family protein [Bdellovibrionota bacterium]
MTASIRQVVLGLIALTVVDSSPSHTVDAIVRAHGGREAFYTLRDVQYRLSVRDIATKQTMESLERYLFDKERSYAKYEKEDREEFFDGRTAQVLINGKKIEDRKKIHRAGIMRKRNYFLFSLPFKLLDHGVRYKNVGSRVVQERKYDVMDISFSGAAGEKADRLRLYLDPKSKRIDQFIFTNVAENGNESFLMKCDWEEINGVWLATLRRYARSDWEGNLRGEWIADEKLDRIQFWNGFHPSDFVPR